MYKLIVFDLDFTLAELGQPVLDEDVLLLKQLESRGYRIAICSGKPTYYLCGMLRQIGLKAPILIGEAGCMIQFGVDLPPRQFYMIPEAQKAKGVLKDLRERINTRFPQMWYQPNEAMLTPFPTEDAGFAWVQQCVEDLPDGDQLLDVYRHPDCFDIMPKGVNKASGLHFLSKLMGIAPEEMIAVGDGANDYPMFAYVGLALGIKVKDETKVDVNYPDITSALKALQQGILL